MSQLIEHFHDDCYVYEVSLDTDMGEGVTGCWIFYKSWGIRDYSSSLQCALDTGYLVCNQDETRTHPIRASLLQEIEDWAIERGY